MMAHTPGPWSFTADMYGLHNMRVFGAADARGNGIANCGYDERGECEANARLIAAAPDLLEALERAYQKLGFWMDDDRWDDSDEAAMVQIWAAIRKAKGEA